MDRFDMKKVILYLSGILVFVVLIMVVLSIKDEEIKNDTPKQSKSAIIETTKLEKTTESTTIETIEPSESIDISEQRADSWESNGTGYLKLAETYRKSFFKALNTGDMTEIELMLVKNSNIYKKQIAQIEKLKKQKIKMGLKSSKLINFSEEGNKIIIKVSEEVGVKSKNNNSTTYKEYIFEYTLVIKNQGLLISNISGNM